MRANKLKLIILSSFAVSSVSQDASAQTSAQVEQLVITASRTPQSLNSTLATIIVISRDEIDAVGNATLPELLQRKAGVEIRTTGGAMDLMMRSIGGVPVRMAAPEIYESLTRGTLDGLIFSYQSSVSYDFGKILKAGTEGLNFGTAIFTYSIGETKFKSLPENVRKALVEAGEQTTREGCKRFEDGEKAATEKIKSQGMKVIAFGPEDQKLFDAAFKNVMEDWVKDIDKRGKPGTEVFKAFTEALAAGR